MKKLLAIAATALLTGAALPAKADGNIGVIAVTACQNIKADIEIGRAVGLAIKSNPSFFQNALSAGYTPEEIGRQTVVQMAQWACPNEIRELANR